METTDNITSATKSSPKAKRKPESIGLVKKLDPDGGKLFVAIKEKINKKNFGRKIKDSEIIAFSLGLLTPEHIKLLQEKTITEKDRLALAHEEYCKENGKISLDQFIGVLVRGHASQNKKTLEK